METVGLFDYEMRNFTKSHLIRQTGEAMVLFHDFVILFCISDIFVNFILLNKWEYAFYYQIKAMIK